MSEKFGPDFKPEVQTEEEWEAKWEEFIRLAREYGWPEEYIEIYVQTHRVSYQERLKSLERFRQLWEAGKHNEAVFENKRTMLREPLSLPKRKS